MLLTLQAKFRVRGSPLDDIGSINTYIGLVVYVKYTSSVLNLSGTNHSLLSESNATFRAEDSRTETIKASSRV